MKLHENVAAVFMPDIDLFAEVDIDLVEIEQLLSIARVVPDEAAAMAAPWLDEIRATVAEYKKLRKAVGPQRWGRMKAMKDFGLREHRKRERLEVQLRRLFFKDRPSALQAAE